MRAVPYMVSPVRVVVVARVDDDEAACGRKQRLHVLVEPGILHQVEDDIQRDGEVMYAAAVIAEKHKRLRVVAGETGSALRERRSRNVDADIMRIAGERELIPVSATEFDHRANPVLGHEIV